jgi:hypothetical protein
MYERGGVFSTKEAEKIEKTPGFALCDIASRHRISHQNGHVVVDHSAVSDD